MYRVFVKSVVELDLFSSLHFEYFFNYIRDTYLQEYYAIFSKISVFFPFE